MIKYISLIILYLLVISSFLTLVIYEQTSETIQGIDGGVYSGGMADFSGRIDIDTLVDLSGASNFQWKLGNNTLVYDGDYYGTTMEKPIYFNGIVPNSAGEYDVTYQIDNVNDLNFELYITQGGISDSSSYILTYKNGWITMYTPYVHTLVGSFFKTELISQSLSLADEHRIQTIVNPSTQQLSIVIDGSTVLQLNTEIKSSYNHYGGFLIAGDGRFIIEEVTTSIKILDEGDSSFLGIIASLMLWNVDEKYLPLAFNIILIKFPMIVLTMAIAFYLRGVS